MTTDKCNDDEASSSCSSFRRNSNGGDTTVLILTVRNASHMRRSWPPTFVAITLAIVAGTMIIGYPVWCLLLAKYRQERDVVVGAVVTKTMGATTSGDSFLVVSILDGMSQFILDTMPRLVAGCLLLYVGLCAGYVGWSDLKRKPLRD